MHWLVATVFIVFIVFIDLSDAVDADLMDSDDSGASKPEAQKLVTVRMVAPGVVQYPLAGGLVVMVQDQDHRVIRSARLCDFEKELWTPWVLIDFNGMVVLIPVEVVPDEIFNRSRVDLMAGRYYLRFHLVLGLFASYTRAINNKFLKFGERVKIWRFSSVTSGCVIYYTMDVTGT